MPTPRALKILVPLIVLMLMAGTAAVVAVTVKKNGGPVTAVRTATSDVPIYTTSRTFVDVAGMSTSVTVPSGQQALLVVTFSGEAVCEDARTTPTTAPTAYCIVRVTVDGAYAQPYDVIFQSAAASGASAYGYASQSIQFVSGALAPGTHVVKVQYMVDESDSVFHLNHRTLTVLRSKIG